MKHLNEKIKIKSWPLRGRKLSSDQIYLESKTKLQASIFDGHRERRRQIRLFSFLLKSPWRFGFCLFAGEHEARRRKSNAIVLKVTLLISLLSYVFRWKSLSFLSNKCRDFWVCPRFSDFPVIGVVLGEFGTGVCFSVLWELVLRLNVFKVSDFMF